MTAATMRLMKGQKVNILDVEGSLVLGRQDEDWQNEPVPCVARVPVLLVNTAEDEVEENEKESHARCAPDADVEPSVVGEYSLLVVAGELVKTGASHG